MATHETYAHACPRCNTANAIESDTIQPLFFWAVLVKSLECGVCSHQWELSRQRIAYDEIEIHSTRLEMAL